MAGKNILWVAIEAAASNSHYTVCKILDCTIREFSAYTYQTIQDLGNQYWMNHNTTHKHNDL